MRHLLSPLAAAEPPSDFTSDDGGGGGGGGRSKATKVLLGLGIGCAGLLLIVGLFAAIGAFKAISFCGGVKDLAMGVAQAQQVSLDFGFKVKGGDWAGAHKLLSDDYQKQVSADQLKAMFAKSGALGTPLADSLKVPGAEQVNDAGEKSLNLETRDVIAGLRFFPDDPSTTKTAIVATLHLKILNTEGETPTVKITKIEPLTEAPIVLAQEQPARTVKQWHKAMNLGAEQQAFFMVGPEIRKGGMKAYKAFIEKEGDLFTDSKLDVRAVSYSDPQTARVIVQLDSASNRRSLVGFGLVSAAPGRWTIGTIAPLATTDNPAPTPEAKPEEAPTAPKGDEAPAAPKGDEQPTP